MLLLWPKLPHWLDHLDTTHETSQRALSTYKFNLPHPSNPLFHLETTKVYELSPTPMSTPHTILLEKETLNSLTFEILRSRCDTIVFSMLRKRLVLRRVLRETAYNVSC